MTTTYVRVCKAHRVELMPDTLVCPIGHECGDEDFLSRERRFREVTPAQSRTIREGLIWVAGVFDAPGSCCVSKHKNQDGKRYRQIVVDITSPDASLVASIQRITGLGGMYFMKGSRPAKGAPHNPRWRFRAFNSSGTRFLLAIKPFLRSKRNAVDKLLQGAIQGRCDEAV